MLSLSQYVSVHVSPRQLCHTKLIIGTHFEYFLLHIYIPDIKFIQILIASLFRRLCYEFHKNCFSLSTFHLSCFEFQCNRAINL